MATNDMVENLEENSKMRITIARTGKSSSINTMHF